MSRAPLLGLLAPFALGIALEDELHLSPSAPLAGAVLGALLWFRLGRRTLGQALLGLALGALALALRVHAPLPAVADGPVELVVLEPPRVRGPSCRVEVWLRGEPAGRALLRAPADRCGLEPGQRALARLAVEPLRPATNPGAPDPRRRWARGGVRVGARLREGLLIAAAPPQGPAALLAEARSRMGDAVDPPESRRRAGAVLRAMVTGDRQRLSPDLRRSFARSGTAHLLAVSGLHVGWVFAITQLCVSWALRRIPSVALLRRAPTAALLAGVTLASAYAGLTGFGVPALRALAMGLAGALAVLGGRPGAALNALAAAALVVLAVDPGSLFEAPFALSFTAVAGIIAWAPPPARRSALVHAALAAGLATAPWIAWLGAPLPVAGVLANLVAVPFFGALVVPLGLLCAALGAAGSGLAPLVGSVAQVTTELGLRVLERLESRDLLFGVEQPVHRSVVLAAAGFALRGLATGRYRLALLGSLVVALAWLGASARPAASAPDQLLALDVGHGDALLVRGGSSAWLVDAGTRTGAFDAGRQVVLPALREEGVAHLDVLVVTHSDRDHLGGVAAVLESVPVGELWLSEESWRHPATRAARVEAARRGVPLRIVRAGAEHRVPRFAVQVLWPPRVSAPASSNESSLVLRIDFAHGCALLLADVPAWVERRLAGALRPCTLLKLAHHGSASSTDVRLLQQLRPEVAISSNGRRPNAPLPHADVRQRLARASVSLWVTARSGAVRVLFSATAAVAQPFHALPWRSDDPIDPSARLRGVGTPPLRAQHMPCGVHQVLRDRRLGRDLAAALRVLARQHEHAATAGASRELDVGGAVADYPARGEIGVELESGTLEQTRRGLATRAARVGQVRAVVAPRDVHPAACEVAEQVILEALEVPLGVVAASDAGLVRDDGDGESGGLQQAQSLVGSGQASVVRERVRIASVLHQRAVAIDEDEAAGHDYRHSKRSSRVRPGCSRCSAMKRERSPPSVSSHAAKQPSSPR